MMKKQTKHHYKKYFFGFLLTSAISVISVCSIVSCSCNQTSQVNPNDNYQNLSTTVYQTNNTQLSINPTNKDSA
ncbi:hypothetical protein J6W20_06205 [bacterium]|nr:hypothetical protein [bacterium]